MEVGTSKQNMNKWFTLKCTTEAYKCLKHLIKVLFYVCYSEHIPLIDSAESRYKSPVPNKNCYNIGKLISLFYGAILDLYPKDLLEPGSGS